MKSVKYFSAVWCGPCKTFKPIMEEISSVGHNVQFIDVDTDSDLASKYGIRSVPTTVIEDNGVEINRIVGASSKQVILENLS